MRKVLIVDDHNLIFNGLKDVLKHFTLDYSPSTEQALEMLKENEYYAVLLDVSIGDNQGFEIITAIPKKSYIFFLSMHKSSLFIQMAKDLGANGYFLKDEPADLLVQAINTPISRAFWMSCTVENELAQAANYVTSNYEKLSPREQQIFSMLVEDISYTEIAKRLGISKKTVNNHRDHIMKKLEVVSQIGLVREAVKLGII